MPLSSVMGQQPLWKTPCLRESDLANAILDLDLSIIIEITFWILIYPWYFLFNFLKLKSEGPLGVEPNFAGIFKYARLD